MKIPTSFSNNPLLRKNKLRFGAVGLLTLVATATAFAQTTWTNTSGGVWEDAANWDTGIPALNVNANLNALANPYSVTYVGPLGVANIGKLTVANTVTLEVNGAGLIARTSSGGATNPGLSIAAGGVVNVNSGGTLEAIHSNSGAVQADISGTLHVNGGTFTSSTGSGSGKYTTLPGSLILDSGAVNFTDGGLKLNATGSIALNGGSFTTTTLQWDGGGAVKFTLDDAFVPLTISGAFVRGTTTGGGYAISLSDSGAQIGDTFTLLTFASTTFSNATWFAVAPTSDLHGTFTLTENSLQFTVTAVPEPSTLAMAALGFAAIFLRRKSGRGRRS